MLATLPTLDELLPSVNTPFGCDLPMNHKKSLKKTMGLPIASLKTPFRTIMLVRAAKVKALAEFKQSLNEGECIDGQ